MPWLFIGGRGIRCSVHLVSMETGLYSYSFTNIRTLQKNFHTEVPKMVDEDDEQENAKFFFFLPK